MDLAKRKSFFVRTYTESIKDKNKELKEKGGGLLTRPLDLMTDRTS